MHRRDLIKAAISGSAAMGVVAAGGAEAAKKATPADDRAYMAGLLQKMAEPVLSNMAAGNLKKNFALEVSPTWDGRDKNVTYMEAFARLMAGVAPWLSLPEDDTAEGRVRKRLEQQALQSFVHSVDPQSPDYLLWRGHGQALVDSAYFTNALMRAPKQLWEPLDVTTKKRIVEEIKGLRRVSPPYTNWLLFAAMNEAFLLSIGEDWDPMRVDLTIKKMEEWYVGDGWVADGVKFHFDYYNSYVIYPMLLEILEVLVRFKPRFNNLKPDIELSKWQKRTQRYCEHLERFISPTGTYPPIGRSLTYRTAAFQPLALMAWRKSLPDKLPEGQVRAALTAVHQAVFSNPGNFTKDGYLTIGFAGHQPELGDWYSNNGSMYITSEGFLALGLPATDAFWTAPALDWTQKKAFAGAKFAKDYAVDY
ncbi:DUF2264 domain-containing protein [Asticcacaulis endophyticus]|uniref:DUF2264 domain-containing protein n=1 Tax=Asticcacaulis endophyticus TaxID=1395890 RepID=A0A918QGK6_9CAUL|nr:DUF2264 domain-containing protein [Asticcacaulis endophyticus]GGZ44281.1 hypothetical protein GCM10011273_33780 [Asticcacaulis endophyticus]